MAPTTKSTQEKWLTSNELMIPIVPTTSCRKFGNRKGQESSPIMKEFICSSCEKLLKLQQNKKQLNGILKKREIKEENREMVSNAVQFDSQESMVGNSEVNDNNRDENDGCNMEITESSTNKKLRTKTVRFRDFPHYKVITPAEKSKRPISKVAFLKRQEISNPKRLTRDLRSAKTFRISNCDFFKEGLNGVKVIKVRRSDKGKVKFDRETDNPESDLLATHDVEITPAASNQHMKLKFLPKNKATNTFRDKFIPVIVARRLEKRDIDLRGVKTRSTEIGDKSNVGGDEKVNGNNKGEVITKLFKQGLRMPTKRFPMAITELKPAYNMGYQRLNLVKIHNMLKNDRTVLKRMVDMSNQAN